MPDLGAVPRSFAALAVLAVVDLPVERLQVRIGRGDDIQLEKYAAGGEARGDGAVEGALVLGIEVMNGERGDNDVVGAVESVREGAAIKAPSVVSVAALVGSETRVADALHLFGDVEEGGRRAGEGGEDGSGGGTEAGADIENGERMVLRMRDELDEEIELLAALGGTAITARDEVADIGRVGPVVTGTAVGIGVHHPLMSTSS